MATTLRRLIEIIINSGPAKQGGDEVKKTLHDVGKAAHDAHGDVKGLHGELGLLSEAGHEFGHALLGLGAGLAAVFGGHEVLEILIDYKKELALIQKTTGANAAEAHELAEEIGHLSTRVPVATSNLAELLGVAYSFGQRGKHEMMDFVETVARLGTVSTIAGAEGARMLGQLLRVAGEPISGMKQLAASIFMVRRELGGSDTEIASTALAIEQMAAGMNMTSDRAVALSGALAAVGAEGNMAGLAIGKLLRFMDTAIRTNGEAADGLAMLAGVTKDEFARAMREDASNAVLLLINGLARVQDEGGNVIEVLQGLDLADGRLLRAVLPLIRGHEKLAEAMGIVENKAENVATLTQREDAVAKSFGSEMTRFKNTLEEVIKRGEPIIDFLTKFVRTTRQVVNELVGVHDATDEVSASVHAFANALRVLAIYQAIAMSPAVIRATATAGWALYDWIVAMIRPTRILTAEQAGFAIASGLAATAVAALIGYDLGHWAYENVEWVNKAADAVVHFLMRIPSTLSYYVKLGITEVKELLLDLADEVTNHPVLAGMMNAVTPGLGTSMAALGGSSKAARDRLAAERAKDAQDYEQAQSDIDEMARLADKQREEEFSGSGARHAKSYWQSFGDSFWGGAEEFSKHGSDAVKHATDEVAHGAEDAGHAAEKGAAGMSKFADGVSKFFSALAKNGDQVAAAQKNLEDMIRSINQESRSMDTMERTHESNRDALQLITTAELAYGEASDRTSAILDEYLPKLARLEQQRKKMASLEGAKTFFEGMGDRQAAARMSLGENVDPEIAGQIATFERIWGKGSEEAEAYKKNAIRVFKDVKDSEDLRATAAAVGNVWGQFADDIAFGNEKIMKSVENLARSLSQLVFQFLVTRQVASFFTGAAGSFFSGAGFQGSGGGGSYMGNTFSGNRMTQFFAGGGIINGETDFPLQGGRGRAGEGGKPEWAIAPLERMPDGRLGVGVNGAGGGGTTVNMRVYARDVGGFRASQGQLIRQAMRAARR